ncbi:MAG: YggT family protein [Leptolyngbya sp. LCM1.Bin17]|uniref:YggT family protein n=1 Tax=Nodosilinea sp. P-1105 TaxID=2546229 RepID=UPI001400AB25|nr:YggT family protein [Nodosilinea sp. P-1105]NMF83285.1 YggT family protein [Nodosilinea sp. P-1105]TVP70384.1 MAG: YggT family protein [Leptolyngbya sp. LCM1.Bin17]
MSENPNEYNDFQQQQEQMRQQERLRKQEQIRQQEAYRLQQETQRLKQAQRRSKFAWVRNTIVLLVGALEILLGIRFFLRLTLANPDNLFVNTIFGISDPFMIPFADLFISPTNADATRIFDVNLLVAMVVYALLGALAIAIVNYLEGQSPYS